jgi:subtilase family serine protease
VDQLDVPIETDSYEVHIAGGQKLSARVIPLSGSGLLPSVTILNNDGTVIYASDNAVVSGESAVVQPITFPMGGTYRIDVTSADTSSTGGYRLEAFLNAQLESESVGSTDNDTLIGAIQLNTHTTLLQGSGRLASAIGTSDGKHKRDLYQFDLSAGEAFSALLRKDADGFGQFEFENTSQLVSGRVHAVGKGDFNQDGLEDVVMAGQSGSQAGLRVLLSDGSGGFYPVAWGTPNTIYDLAIADFDSDGNLDIATISLGHSSPYEATSESTRLTLYFGDGSGNADRSYDRYLWGTAYCLTPGDFDGNHQTDLAVGFINTVDEFTPDPGSVGIFLGDGTGDFDAGVSYALSGKPYDIATVDLNQDGLDDLVVGQGDENEDQGWISRLIMSQTSPGFVGYIASDTYDDPIIRVAAGDFNHANGGDYLGLHLYSRNVSVTLTDDSGNPTVGYGIEPLSSGFSSTSHVVVSDVNRDGFLDLLVSSGGYGSEHDSINLSLNDGNGYFFAGTSSYDKMGDNIGPFEVADLNGDGDVDLVGFSGQPEYDPDLGDDVVEVSTRLGIGEVGLELLDASGNRILVSGFSGFGADTGILDFVSTSGGTIYLSVTGDFGQGYRLAVTGAAKFGMNPELIDDRSQDMTLAGQVAARINSPSETDIYTINLNAGDTITVQGIARNQGPGAPGNDLIPTIELLDPSGTVVISDLNLTNTSTVGFVVSISETGTYKLRISAQSGSGDYDIRVTGQTGSATPFAVQSTNPPAGITVGDRPWVGVKFTQPVLLSSVQADDLLVNGQPAAEFFPVSPFEIYWNTGNLFPTDGSYTITIPAGSIISSLGQVLGAYSFNFNVDAVGPRVTSSTLIPNQTIAPGPFSWNAAFDEELVTFISDGIFAYLVLDTGDVQTTNLSNGTTVGLSQMQHLNPGPNYGPTELGFAYANLTEGRYEVRFKSGGMGFNGYGPNGSYDFQPLDGEFNGGFPSGDGWSGGDFVFNFNVDAPGITPLTAMTALSPAGSIVHELSTVRAFHATGDMDSFTIDLDSNQQITVMLIPQGGFASAKLELRDPNGVLLGSSTGSTGQTVVLQSVNGTTGGTYRIDATSLDGITGYTLRVVVNAVAEDEASGIGSNNTRATAQTLLPRTLVSGFTGMRAAVVGDATGSEDYYRIDLIKGKAASFALSGIEGASVSFRLENSSGTVLTRGAGGQANADQVAIDFIAPFTGSYYVVVSGSGRYNLLVTRDASYERELSPAPTPAQDLSINHQVVGHLKGGMPGTAAIDVLQIGPNFANPGGNLDRLIDQLNDDTYYNFNATRRTVSDASTYETLAPYDVVILTQLLASQYTPGLASALKKYVELGGAVIVSGSVVQTFSGSTISPFAQLLPFIPTSGVSATYGVLAPETVHPITSLYNPTNFPVSAYYPLALAGGSTVLGRTNTQSTLIIRDQIGFGGRTIFLGPEYADQYESSVLRSGNPDRLLEQTVAWAAQSGDQSDAYSLSLLAGNSIILTTSTPNTETAMPVNRLDPVLELYDPSGVLVASNDNGPDGRNSRIVYTAPTSGNYRVVVRAKETDGGAYTLQVTGATGSALVVGPKVIATTPNQTPLPSAPTTLDIVLSENILASSVQVSDLTIAGGTVTSAQLIDGRTVRFFISVPDTDGTYNYSIPAGAFTDLQGDVSEAHNASFSIDKLGPYVVSSNPISQASSPFTTWSFTFNEDLSALPTSYGYSQLFDIIRPDGTLLPSWFVNSALIQGNTFTIQLSPQTVAGNYTVVLKPLLFKDLRGNGMDQDRDGTGGESVQDQYISTISLASPNLVVDSVEVLNTPVWGSPVTVRWTVRNAGSDPASDGWQDRVYLSLDDAVDGNDLILLTIGTSTLPLAPGQTYTREQTINLPLNTTIQPGSYRFLVRTDRANTQQESNENDNTTPSSPVQVDLPVLPDLAVTNVHVSPVTPTSGQNITVQWTLTNVGTASVSGVIRDRVLLSSDAILGSDVNLGEFDYAVNLAPGASVTRSAVVTLPVNQSGSKWVGITTDVSNTIFEHTNESNNTTFTSEPVSITLAPVPDLRITSIQAPASVVSGTAPVINWTLINNGTASFSGTISENIYLSSDPTIGDDEPFKTVTFTGTIAVGQSITRTTTLPIPIQYSGTRYVVITTDSLDQVFEDAGESNNTTLDDQPMVISLPPTPDLIVTGITAPIIAQSGRSVVVQWQLTNQGHAPVSGPFTESIFLSSDSTIGNDQFFGAYTFNGSIAPGQTITRSQTIQLPNIYEGTYRVVIVTDSGSQVFENTWEDNNASIDDADLIISQSPYPNLVVSSITAPPTASSEQNIDLEWVVSNIGQASTSALGWMDRVYLSSDATFDSTDTLLTTVPNASFLAAGDSYSQTATIRLPQGLQGQYHFVIATDAYNHVFEHAPPALAENDNISISSTIDITLTPPPDFVVSSVSAPLVAFSGEINSVSWIVRNQGSGTNNAQQSWIDDVWLSTDPTLGENDVLLGSFPRQGTLAPGASYSQTANVRLPVGIQGSYYFIVRTDANSQVYEDAFEANNTTAETSATEVLLAPPADLRVNSLNIPAAATAGRGLLVQYSVINDGASRTPTPSWTDRIYLSPTPTLESSTAILIGTRGQYGHLVPGASYTASVSTTVPINLPPGQYYVFVATDAQEDVFEIDNTNNVVGSVGTVTISRTFADLQINSFTPPATAEAGTGTVFSWTISNNGTGDTIVGQWTDQLILSGDNVLGNGDDIYLWSENHTGLLNPGGSYTITRSVPIPQSVAAGEYNLFLRTDAYQQVTETDKSNNSNALTPVTLIITRQTPDLQITQITVPSVAESLQAITVSFTVENRGTAATQANSWVDGIWLSLDDTLDSDDILLDQVQRSGSLLVNGSYTVNRTMTLPEVTGNYRIIVRTDRFNSVVEGALKNNNDRASDPINISQSPVPDLQVTSVSAPVTAFTGQQMTVSYMVHNQGSGIASGMGWYDTIYLSQDAALDDSDRVVGSVYRAGPLNNGQSYSIFQEVTLPPGLSGEYHLIVRTDSTNRIYERENENNNISVSNPALISLLPPVDLVAGAIVLPVNGTPGQNASITYTVTNSSSQTAQGRWSDTLYLSKDPVWDINDRLFAKHTQSGPLAPGDHYSPTVTAPLPGVTPGEYYVIIRSDILNQIPESDENNNLSASVDRFELNVPALTLGTPVGGTLSQSQGVYYRVTVPAGQTLLIDLDASTTAGSTQLFVKYGDVPSRASFDYGYTDPLSPDQKIIVPVTETGTYYILAYGENVSSPISYSLQARLLEFEVVDTNYGIGGNGGKRTLQINGAKFDRTITPTLVSPSGAERAASRVYYTSSTRLYATFDLNGLTPNVYDVKLTKSSGESVLVPDGLQVVTARPTQTRPVIFSPSVTGAFGLFQFTVSWGNDGINDAPAPYLVVTADRPIGQHPDYIDAPSYSFLGAPQDDGPAGLIRPGKTAQREFYARNGPRGSSIILQADRLDDGRRQMDFDWSSIRPYFQSLNLTTQQVDAVFAQMISDVGTTWGQVVDAAADGASLLPSQLGFPRHLSGGLQVAFLQAAAKISTSLSGRIFAPDIEVPIADQTITATNLATGQTFTTVSLIDGSFYFTHLTPGTYELRSQRGLVSGGAIFTVSANEHKTGHVLSLEKGSGVLGVVRSAVNNNQVLAGAVVRVINEDGDVFNTLTNNLGVYRIDGLPEGVYTLIIDAPGHARMFNAELSLTSTTYHSQNITLQPESTIAGTITSAVGPESIIRVSAVLKGTTSTPAASFNGVVSGNHFILQGLPSGEYDVRIERFGYVTFNQQVVVSTHQSYDMGNAHLARAGSVQGQVQSTTAALVHEGMLVGLYRSGETDPAYTTLTDENGGFVFEDVAPGDYQARLEGASALKPGTSVSVTTGTTSSITLTVYPGGAIEGTISNSLTSEILTDWVVVARSSTGELFETRTDDDGKYRIQNLLPGQYTVYVPGASSLVTLTDLSGNSPSLADLSVPVAGTIQGNVHHNNGTPAVGTVTIYKSGRPLVSAPILADGSYELSVTQAGTYDIIVEATGGAYAPVLGATLAMGTVIHQDFVSGTATLDVGMSGYPGNPSQGIARLYRVTPLGLISSGSDQLSTGGSATFAGLLPGEYELHVYNVNGFGGVRRLTVTVGSNLDTMTLQSLSRLQGSVTVSGSGIPLEEATILLQPVGSTSGTRGIRTAADGSYDLADLLPGTYDVSIFKAGHIAFTQAGLVVPSGGGTVSLNAALIADSSLVTGRILMAPGVTAPNGTATITTADGRFVLGSAESDSNGSFQIVGVSGANLTIEIITEGGGRTVLTGQNIVSGATLAMGDIIVSPEAHAKLGQLPEMASLSPLTVMLASLGSSTGGSMTLNASPTEAPPPVDYEVIPYEKSPNHHSLMELPDLDRCRNCTNTYNNARNQIILQDRLFEIAGEYRRLSDRFALQTMAAIPLETAQNLGLLAQAALSIEVLAANAAKLGLTRLAATGAYEFGTTGVITTARWDAAYSIAQVIGAFGSLHNYFEDIPPAQTLSEKVFALLDALNQANNLMQILNTAITALDAFIQAGAAVTLAAGGVALNALGALFGIKQILENLTYTQTRSAWRDAIWAERMYKDTFRRYERQVDGADSAIDLHYRCLVQAPQDCDPTQDQPFEIIDYVRPIPVFTSSDPNDILGPTGFGPQKFVPSSVPLDYTIRFENEPTASAPAQVVTITQTLDSDLDPRSFRLGDFGFSGQFFDVPADSSFYQTRLDLRESLGIYLDVVAGVDLIDHQIFWRFISIDPTTGDVPTNPLLGFLPINTQSPEGEGFVQYTIRTKSGVQTGDVIDAMASIVFDQNAPIETPVIFNTLDVNPPTSSVESLPPVSGQNFVVFWNGQDDAHGSGIRIYDVYVSTNGGEYVLWLDDTDLTQATFAGEPGKTYAFYSVTVDNVGNIESVPVTADTVTTVGGQTNTPPILNLDESAGTLNEGSNFTRSGTATDADPGDTISVQVDYGLGEGFVPLILDSNGQFILNKTYTDNGTYTVIVRVTDASLETVTRQFMLTVSNVPPSINPIPDQVISWDGSGGTLSLGGTFTDPGADTFVGEVNYGSGFVPLVLNTDGTFTLNHRYVTPGLYIVVVRVTDDDGGTTEQSMTVRLLPPVPRVSGIQVNDGNAQRSMVKTLTVTLDNPLTTFPVSAVTIKLRTPSGPQVISATVNATQQDSVGRVWTLSLTGAGLEGGSLADGYYDVAIDQSQLIDAFGQSGTGIAQTSFHRLFGDFDGDMDADAVDSAKFRPYLQGSSPYLWYFDSDSDGDVDTADYTAARLRLRTRIFV